MSTSANDDVFCMFCIIQWDTQDIGQHKVASKMAEELDHDGQFIYKWIHCCIIMAHLHR